MEYQHTQFSPALFRATVLLFVAAIVISAAAAGNVTGLVVVLFIGVIIGVAMSIFSRLTVEVGGGEVRATFGWGWPRRVVLVADVLSATRIRNRWWYGFGIRWYPGGTLWNVWGLDAVEFDVGESRKLRLGTDEPGALLAALPGGVRTS